MFDGGQLLHHEQFAGILFTAALAACDDLIEGLHQSASGLPEMLADLREAAIAGC